MHLAQLLRFARLKVVEFIQHPNLKKRKLCATLWLQREMPQMQFSNGCNRAGKSNADNVKARVLHVMNMNHTKKKAEHMQQKEKRQIANHGRFPFRIKKIKRKHSVDRNKEVSRSWMESEEQKDSKMETSKRLTKHHEPKSKAQNINWAMQSEESEVNQ